MAHGAGEGNLREGASHVVGLHRLDRHECGCASLSAFRKEGGMAGEILALLKDKENRLLYLDNQIRRGIAIQVRAMRERRGWTEAELGKRARVSELAITAIEAGAYPNITIPMLKRLASAFDVALVTRLTSFDELYAWAMQLDRIAVPSFDDEE